MIYFGIPSYGMHINGWVRHPQAPTDPRPWALWIAKRSMGKATYAGLYDQMVAGGQPTGLSFSENMRKECEEEASLPPAVITTAQQTGLVSYRYATRKGLSTKVLATYDLEMPDGLLPICADGEVEEFRLLPIVEVLRSIREELPLWKPNSALVCIDFAIRHGFIDFDEPGYMELAHKLRAGYIGGT
jgi:8-oxo-dGTP pyrophosphatase MutT (NUDIX family)